MPADKILKYLTSGEKILLVIHKSPDGDTIASSLALYAVLKKMGKDADIVGKDEIPALFSFLPNACKIQNDFLQGDYDLVIVLDCGDLKRTGFPQRFLQYAKHKRHLLNIDHHPKNDLHKIANLNIVCQEASSTAEILFDFFQEINIDFDKNLATCLLTGLYTDTGGFKHSNTSEKVLDIAGKLLSYGANLKQIAKNISVNKSVTALKLWGIALSRIWQNQQYGLCTSVITRKDLQDCRACEIDMAGIVNLISSIADTKIAIFFSETADGKVRASLRTEDDNIDVSQIAKIFGGGGHKKAAGFTVEGRLNYKEGKWQVI